MSMLEVRDLVVSYGGIEALKGISFDVEEGNIVTLIGANGAGKSTTLRSITGIVPIQSGSITFMGEDITRMDTQKIVSKGIALVPEGRRVFANLTVLENLKIGAYLRKDKAEIEKDIQWVYSLFPRLEERSWQLAGTLSGGEQQMLAVGRALMSRPKLLLIDELTAGFPEREEKLLERNLEELRRWCGNPAIIRFGVETNLKGYMGYMMQYGKITEDENA